MVGTTNAFPLTPRTRRTRLAAPSGTLAPRRPIETALWMSVAGVALALSVLIIGLALYGVGHQQVIYNGVHVAGIDVGGLSEADATARLDARAESFAQTPVLLEVSGTVVETTPAELGFDLDASATARSAMGVARDGNYWNRSQLWARSLLSGSGVAPVVQYDLGAMNRVLDTVAAGVMIPAQDAQVSMLGVGGPMVDPGVDGVAFDRTGSRARIQASLGRMSGEPIPLVVVPLAPAVSEQDLASLLPQAVAAVDDPLVLSTAEGAWSVVTSQLAQIVSVDGSSSELVVQREPLEALVWSIAGEMDTNPIDAAITIDEDGQLVVVPGRDAAYVDIKQTTELAVSALTSGDSAVDIVVQRQPPGITNDDAARGAAEAEAYIADGATLTWPDGTLDLGRSDLLQALTIQTTGGDPFLFGLDSAMLSQLIEPTLAELDDPAQDAKLRLVDGKIKVVQRSSDGQFVDRGVTLDRLVTALFSGDHEIDVEIRPDIAAVTEDDTDGIQFPDVLAEAETYYTGSSDPRRRNVERSAELEDGWLVAPGAIFSFVDNVGDIDAENGFATGFGIVADQEQGGVTTAPVMGGGICQVSTTIFQAAWWSGMEIVERYEHPYWLTGYGQPPLGQLGLDAMVNVEETWALDLKFRNVTDDWIAVTTRADGDALTVTIRGTDPQWDIDVAASQITQRIAPDAGTDYVDSAELPVGQELQVETAHEGFVVEVERTVRDRDGSVLSEDTLSSSYAPSRNLILRGTGT